MRHLTDKINLAMITSTAAVVMWIFTNFASSAEVDDLRVDIWYGQFYDRLDDRDEAVAEGNAQLAAEYERQMEKLKAKICEKDPEWERCN